MEFYDIKPHSLIPTINMIVKIPVVTYIFITTSRKNLEAWKKGKKTWE